jgi:hypothetical protein
MIDTIKERRAPAWAWDVIDSALREYVQSKDHQRSVAEPVRAALVACVLADHERSQETMSRAFVDAWIAEDDAENA